MDLSRKCFISLSKQIDFLLLVRIGFELDG